MNNKTDGQGFNLTGEIRFMFAADFD